MKDLIKVTFLIFISFSCKKDSANPFTQTVVEKSTIVAGQTGIGVTLTVQDTFVVPVYDVMDTPGYMIDINKDGKNDFSLSVVNQFYVGPYFYICSLRIKTLNSKSYICCNTSWTDLIYTTNTTVDSIGQLTSITTTLQTVIDSISPKIISQNDIISQVDNWRQGNFNLLSYTEVEERYFDQTCYIGNWRVDNKYIGIKCESVLGWIKVQVMVGSIRIYEFAEVH